MDNIAQSKFSKCYKSMDEYLNQIKEKHRRISFQLVSKNTLGEEYNIIVNDIFGCMVSEEYFKNNQSQWVYKTQEYIMEQLNNNELAYIPNYALTKEFYQKLKMNPKFETVNYRVGDEDKVFQIEESILNDIKNSKQDIAQTKDNKTIWLSAIPKNKIYVERDLTPKNKLEIQNVEAPHIKYNMSHFRKTTSEIKTMYSEITKSIKETLQINPTIVVEVAIEDRTLAKETGLYEALKTCQNPIINCELSTYTIKEYEEDEMILDTLADPIKNANLSPYEKYIAAYNLTKQFKKYKDNPEAPFESRNLKEVLRNEYMVCVGYQNLLKELCNRIGIVSTRLAMELTGVGTALGKGSGHVRNLIYLKDDKYQIDGIYMADATWDNDLEKDMYLWHAITFDQATEAGYPTKLNKTDLLLDIHSMEEFNIKVNYLLDKQYKKKEESLKDIQRITNVDNTNFKDLHSNLVMEETYKEVIEMMIDLVMPLNESLAIALRDDLKETYQKGYNIPAMKRMQNYKDIITAYGNFVITKVNKKIPIGDTLLAIRSVKELTGMSQDEIVKSENEMLRDNLQKDLEEFIYIYDGAINSHKLDDRQATKTR